MSAAHPTKHSSAEPLVRARGLTKTFNAHRAVDSIDFDIWPKEIVGFLGPNGAGKTTTIRMMLNVLNPTTGELTLFGHTFDKSRKWILRQMNASSGTLTLPGKLSAKENLTVFADMYGLSQPERRIAELMNKLDLVSLQDKPLYSLSTGQQVRVSLAKAFINRPRLLLLDEPTASLDPDVADRVRSLLVNIVKEEETTVFLTSHNMAEVEKVCTRVLFLNNGRIQAEGTPKELARKIERMSVFLRTKKALSSLAHLKTIAGADVTFDNKDIRVEIDRNKVGPFLTDLVQQGVEIETISFHEPTLEDFFVHTTRKGNEEILRRPSASSE